MANDQEFIAQLQKTNSEKQVVELLIEEQQYKRLRKTLGQRVQPKRKPGISSPDQIVFTGLKGTLEKKTLSVGYNMELKNWKCKCIAYLSRNVIVDFTNKDQLKLIGVSLKKLNSRYQLFIEGEGEDLKEFSDMTKKTENHSSVKKVLKNIEAHNYADTNERAIKMIYVHILDQIVNKPTLFLGSSQKQFSELSFLVKFWGPIIELFFDANHYCVQWGDTTSPHLSLSNLHFNLDLRVIVKDINTDKLDVVTGEFTRQSSTTASKLYRDFLKSALTTKVHLNAILKRIPFLPAAKIKTIVVPMIQIMGLSCVVYGMNIIDKKVYTLQKVASFNYPSTLREVKSNGIKSLLDGFTLVKFMIDNIKEMIVEYSKMPNNDMQNIKNGRKRKADINTIDIDQYISPVIQYPCPKDVEDEFNEQEDDEQEDDDYNE